MVSVILCSFHILISGAYLVRKSNREPNAYTLCMLFDSQVRNYKLFFDNGQHYVGEKRFDSLHDLVQDGLIHMHIEKHAADYIKHMTDEIIYEESPYRQYQRMRRSVTSLNDVPMKSHSWKVGLLSFSFAICRPGSIC